MLQLLDTTLRDGTQQYGISFSAFEKLQIAEKLDELGVHYIEGGWPGSNPKDSDFFQLAKKKQWKNATIAAFGSTHHKKFTAATDPNLQAILDTDVKAAVLVGKSSAMHVTEILGVSLEKNLKMITDSITYLKKKGLTVIFDAEHFFDGYELNVEYSLRCLEAAVAGGADNLTLADTNGGMMVTRLKEIVSAVKEKIDTPLGIHCHNDCELAVANSLAAVEAGVELVQGTINGYGERCGNANLCSILPDLQLKMGHEILSEKQLRKLSYTSLFVQKLANVKERYFNPYVGSKAFAHKGGLHVAAMRKNAASYQHIDPELVGNKMHIAVSELSGRGNIVEFAKQVGIDLEQYDTKVTSDILKTIKELEHEGFQFEGAEASLQLLISRHIPGYQRPFEVIDYIAIIKHEEIQTEDDGDFPVEATVKMRVGNNVYHEAAGGNGPVHALDKAFQKALHKEFPQLENIKLYDFKVRIVNSKLGANACTSVLIEMGNDQEHWFTTGSSQNIIEASFMALLDGYEYGVCGKGECLVPQG